MLCRLGSNLQAVLDTPEKVILASMFCLERASRQMNMFTHSIAKVVAAIKTLKSFADLQSDEKFVTKCLNELCNNGDVCFDEQRSIFSLSRFGLAKAEKLYCDATAVKEMVLSDSETVKTILKEHTPNQDVEAMYAAAREKKLRLRLQSKSLV